ncbi:MAG: hypothetical protein V3U29_03390 [Phycisphaeraceae bacterium]
MRERIEKLDRSIAGFLHKYGHLFLRVSLGVVFIWFGILKPFGLSPATELVGRTVYWAVPPAVFVPILGWWEVLIGLCLLVRPLVRVALGLLALQMCGTLLPLVLLPDVCFQPGRVPWGPTLEGQYIIKNLVLIGAAMVIGSTVRQRSDAGRML